MSTNPATSLPIPPDIVPERTLSAPEWGMASFLFSEVAFFSTLIVAYVTYRGADIAGPTDEVLALPLAFATTACLIASSFTVHLAEHALAHQNRARFHVLWAATIALGIVFLLGTAYEWRELVVEHGLKISTNLFGSTYYTLVGFHALHVTAGVITMLIVLGVSFVRTDPGANPGHAGQSSAEFPLPAVRLTSWYWHFVDVVWIVVFSIVYLRL